MKLIDWKIAKSSNGPRAGTYAVLRYDVTTRTGDSVVWRVIIPRSARTSEKMRVRARLAMRTKFTLAFGRGLTNDERKQIWTDFATVPFEAAQ